MPNVFTLSMVQTILMSCSWLDKENFCFQKHLYLQLSVGICMSMFVLKLFSPTFSYNMTIIINTLFILYFINIIISLTINFILILYCIRPLSFPFTSKWLSGYIPIHAQRLMTIADAVDSTYDPVSVTPHPITSIRKSVIQLGRLTEIVTIHHLHETRTEKRIQYHVPFCLPPHMPNAWPMEFIYGRAQHAFGSKNNVPLF